MIKELGHPKVQKNQSQINDKAPAYGVLDCRFESSLSQKFFVQRLFYAKTRIQWAIKNCGKENKNSRKPDYTQYN